MKPPLPKNAACPNESSPVKPNRMSKPNPKMPQIRMRSAMSAVPPINANAEGNSSNATTATASGSHRRRARASIVLRRSLAALNAEQALRPENQHDGHRGKQHHFRVSGLHHRGQADDFTCNKPADQRAPER